MIDFKDRKEPYFIAEIGLNHNSDLKIVKKLIDAAFACNWDAVKFQKRTPEICVPEKIKNVIRTTPWGDMTYLEYRKKMEFGKREYNYIDKYCSEKPISWFASVWDVDSLEFLLQYDVPFVKIPSALLTDHELLKKSAQCSKTLLISTGMSTLEELDRAVNTVSKYTTDFVLMHCNSSYPASHDELNLRFIPRLRERYGCVVGYSGHEVDLEPSVLATALGAQIVERHVTLDHEMWGSDHRASLEVHAMDMLKKRCKDVRVMLGDGFKKVYPSEEKIREKLRKINV